MKKRSHGKTGGNWLVVLVAFYSLFLYSGCFVYGFSLFIKPLQAQFAWDRSTILLGFTLFMMSTAAMSPFVGKILSKFGARKAISAGALLTAVSFSLLFFVKSPLQFYLVFILIGIFSSMIGPISATSIVSEAFKNKRGLAIGLSSTGVGVGGFVIAPLVGGIIIPGFGWGAGYLFMAFLIALMAPLAYTVLKSGNKEKNAVKANDIILKSNRYLKKVFISIPFFLLSVTFFMNNFGVLGLTQSQTPFLQDAGFSVSVVASMIGLIGLVSAFSKLFFGWLCDRIKPAYAYTIGSSVTALSIIILMIINPDSSPALIWAFPVLAGIGMGSWLPTLSMTVSANFPIAYYGFVFGAASVAQNLGASFGPLAGGKIFDASGDYHWAFMGFIIAYAVSIISILAIKRSEPVSSTGRAEVKALLPAEGVPAES